jgi:hypothetical protein
LKEEEGGEWECVKGMTCLESTEPQRESDGAGSADKMLEAVGRFFVVRTLRAGLGQKMSEHEPPFLDTEYD